MSVGVVLVVIGGTFNDQGIFDGTSSSIFRFPVSLTMAPCEDDEEIQVSVRAEHVDIKSPQIRLEWIIASRPVGKPCSGDAEEGE